MEVVAVVLYLEDDDLWLDGPPSSPPAAAAAAAASLGVVTAFPAAAADDRALPSGEALPSVLGKGELARLGTASAFVGTDDTVPSPAASDMGAGLAVRVVVVSWLVYVLLLCRERGGRGFVNQC